MVADDARRFRVRYRHEDAHHGHIVSEASFEAAALASIDHLPLRDEQTEVSVIVHELATGREHSFLIHLEPGETRLVL